jgi:hypothetical protein
MPTDETPTNVNEPKRPADTGQDPGAPVLSEEPRAAEPATPVVRGSRWVDYDTHELLQMISELEDERRWARFREGVWLAILVHLALLSAVTWIPRYVFKVPPVVDSSGKLDQHKDFTYLDSPKWQPKAEAKPALQKPVVIDKKTLDTIKRETPPAPQTAPAPSQQAAAPATPAPQPVQPREQGQLEAPHPAAVPARPNFAMGSQNPADQLRDAMRGSARNRGSGSGNMPTGGGLPMHPGAGSGGVQVLSDTQGVDFNGWLQRWHRETQRTWDPLIPDEVNPPIYKSGMVAIRFKVLPNGRLMDGSVILEGRSGDVALDRAAWGALVGSNYPPLPHDFHGPYLELRAYFLYNTEPRR